ncbi:MAG: hypothetical protein H6658_06040 [Ardenticatenaceae bacterium]|nr:hypothetical protein [Ardenticatenaceae bacterium]
MRRKIFVLIPVLIILLSEVALFFTRQQEVTAVVDITPRLDGVLLGSVNNNGRLSVSNGFYQCIGQEEEAQERLNQLLSYNMCNRLAQPPGCNASAVNHSLTPEEIESSFTIVEEGQFFRIEPAAPVDSRLLGTEATTLHACHTDFLNYINLAYEQGNSSLYYPYELPPGLTMTDVDSSRRLDEASLLRPTLGIAQISAAQIVDEAFLTDFMNLLYELDYFAIFHPYGGTGQIVNREIRRDGRYWYIEDRAISTSYSDMIPFVGGETDYRYTLEVDTATNIVIAKTDILGGRTFISIPPIVILLCAFSLLILVAIVYASRLLEKWP